MVDGYVQVAPDASGKKVATLEITRASDANTVEIQLVALADPATGIPLLTVDGRLNVDSGQDDLQLSFTTEGSLLDTDNNSDIYTEGDSVWTW